MAEDDLNDEELAELLDSALSDIDTAKQSAKSFSQTAPQANQANNSNIPSNTQAKTNVNFEAEAAKLAQLFSNVGMNDGEAGDEENLEKLLSMMQSSLGQLLSSEDETPADKNTRSSDRTSSPLSTAADSGPKDTTKEDNPIFKALEDLSSNLPEFGESDFGASASGSPDAFLSAMLGPLLARNVVYDPLKSLTEKYPNWLDTQSSGPEKESRVRQAELMKKVCLEYEHALGEGGNLDSSQIQKVAALLESAMKEGPPPPELVDSDEQENAANLPECKSM